MKMTETKGEVNNDSFKRELILTKISESYKDINYLEKIEIGGLNKIILKRENSTITEYEGKEYIGENRRCIKQMVWRNIYTIKYNCSR